MLKIRYENKGDIPKEGLPKIDGTYVIVRCSSGIVVGYGEGAEALREKEGDKCCQNAVVLSSQKDDVVFFDYTVAEKFLPNWLGIEHGVFMNTPKFGIVYSDDKYKNDW